MSNNNSPPSRGGLFRFGTRDLLWAMVVVALALGWWRTYRRVAIAEHNAQALQGAFTPGELTFDRSGRIREMPLWSPLSSGRSTGADSPPASGK